MSDRNLRLLRRAFDGYLDAKSYYESEISLRIPKGSSVSYTHGQHTRRVEVLDHSCDRILVRGLGEPYWIYACRLFEDVTS